MRRRWLPLLFPLTFVLIPRLAFADEPLSFRGTFTWINAASYTEVGERAQNPQNTVLKIPESSFLSEMRPNLRLVHPAISLIARPRVRLLAEKTEVANVKGEFIGRSSSTLSEAYAQWTLSERLTFAYGLQNYQWGPTESLSPSNRLFHETALARNILYDVTGRHLARMNMTFGRNLSLVLMTETEANDDIAPFIAEEEFQTTTLLKGEVSWNSGSDYFGLVAGGREHGRPWVGEYFSVSVPFIAGLSFYGDLSHQRGSSAYYPTKTKLAAPTSPTGVVTQVSFEQGEAEKSAIRTMAVGGWRYDFIGGTILRVEYLWNGPGLDDDERDLASQALSSEDPPQIVLRESNLRRSLTPGLELPGQRYAYASITIADLLDVQDLMLFVRSLYSLTDQSSNSYLSIEYGVGDAGTIFLASSATAGDDSSELAGFTEQSHSIGYKHVW